MRKTIISAVLILLAIYLAICGLMYSQQRRMMYFPSTQALDAPNWATVETVHTSTADGLSLVAWFSPPKEKGGKVIVFFHGNAGNLVHMAGKAKLFKDAGYGIFLCEYRGYGGNPGSPTEAGLFADGRAAFTWLKAQGYKPEQFVVYGESLGTGVAVQMAKEMQPRELILEAAFSSTADVAKFRYGFLPVDLLMHDRYDSVSKIGDIKTALLQIHGDRDNVVPLQFGKKLFAAAHEPKTFMFVPGANHDNLYTFRIGPNVVKWLDAAVKAERTTQ
ncbi:MAG: alpha/beta hydrolase [Micavibrio sp.]|nr:alpha/beta hydrolase [Micavibrio sp.]